MIINNYRFHLHWFLRLLMIVAVLLIFWIFINYFIPGILPAVSISNSTKYGFVFRNERWSGTILIRGDIWALPGVKVTVDPGTEILVATDGDRFNLNFLPWDLKSGLNTGSEKFGIKNGELFLDEGQRISLHFGKFEAVGTSLQPITIKSNPAGEPSPYDINLISIEQGNLKNVKISNYRKLEIGSNVSIESSEFYNAGSCAICIKFADSKITNNIFDKAVRQYIWVYGGNPKISGNLFKESKGMGVVVDPHRFGKVEITGNTFDMSNSIAINFLTGAEEEGGNISFNSFASGSIIQLPCDSKVSISQNIIQGNLKLADSLNCTGTMTIGLNYWLGSDKDTVPSQRILGKKPGFSVLVPGVLTSSPSGAGRKSD